MSEEELLQKIIGLVYAMSKYEYYSVPRYKEDYEALHKSLYQYYKKVREAAKEEAE